MSQTIYLNNAKKLADVAASKVETASDLAQLSIASALIALVETLQKNDHLQAQVNSMAQEILALQMGQKVSDTMFTEAFSTLTKPCPDCGQDMRFLLPGGFTCQNPTCESNIPF